MLHENYKALAEGRTDHFSGIFSSRDHELWTITLTFQFDIFIGHILFKKYCPDTWTDTHTPD